MPIAGVRLAALARLRGGARAHRALVAGNRHPTHLRLRGAASLQRALVAGVSSAMPVAGVRRATLVHR
eukprot:2231378-Alexandrium_andersonii.AAC.1